MKTFVTFVAAMTVALGSHASNNIDLNTLASHLAGMKDYASSATFEVLLPTSEFPVVYQIKLASTANEGDSLAAAEYLIDWKLEKDGNHSEGFSAYFPGHHYRYRDQRLQEYHYTTPNDAPTFAPGGDVSHGVQNQAQFCDLLPQYLGQTFASMMTDSTYKYTVHADTIISRQKVIAIDGVRSFGGIEALEYLYILDRDMLPLKTEFVSNPGQIGEQLITATYDYSNESTIGTVNSEEELIELYPEVFERFRESSFRLENLPGRRLPAFTAPTTTGERYAHTKDSKFAAPTVIAILDAEVGSTGASVRLLREAIDNMPMQVDLILAFVSNNVDRIEQLVGEIRAGEHLLMSARGLARDCGVTDTPVILICDKNAEVKDLHIGFNNDIGDFVIEKTALIAK